MSGSAGSNPTPIVGTPPVTFRDKLVANAVSIPDLIAKAKVQDPQLADALTGKALIYSKSIYGPPIVAGLTWLSSKYMLGWDPDTCALIAGVITWCASIAFRYFTSGPITGIVSKAPDNVATKGPSA